MLVGILLLILKVIGWAIVALIGIFVFGITINLLDELFDHINYKALLRRLIGKNSSQEP